jgi:hypothetical protein
MMQIVILFGIVILTILGWYGYKTLARSIRLKRAIGRAKEFVMLEILVPKEISKQENEVPRQLKEIISVMEQLLTSLSGFYVNGFDGAFGRQPTFSLEIVARHNEIRFFIGTPKEFESSIEKQILSYYPESQVERSEAFKIAEDGYAMAGGQLKLMKKFILPIQTYAEVEADPLQAITTSLSKMGTDSRALVQILLQPTDNSWRVPVEAAIKKIQDGKDIVINNQPFLLKMAQSIGKTAGEAQHKTDPAAGAKLLSPAQQQTQKLLQDKGAKVGFKTFVNVMTVAPHKQEAQYQLANILSVFSQYNSAQSNGFRAKRIHKFKDFLIHTFLRAPQGKGMILNASEITSLFHPPNYTIDTPGIIWLLARFAPAPTNTPTQGILLGENIFRGQHKQIFAKAEDRRRHMYVVGMTGTGKSTLFENMVLQDIRAGKGVCYIDPHGDVVENVLKKIPRERAKDVIYFDPGNLAKPIGLNLLDWQTPEEKDFLINEFLLMFYKLFDPNKTGMIGPQFEHWARNAALTIMANPEGGTLIEIPRLFTDDAFREKMISHVSDPVVLRFWNEQLAKTADFHKSEMYNYFISKFGRFMTNELMRNIIGQPKSGLNFPQIMDEGKILLVNLSKGKLGDINAFMLGMIIVAKINSATLARQSIPEEQRKDFYLYVDEFQNIATDTFATILSEARKYRLNLNITHQYIAQLPEEVRNAVFGNVGTIISFRIGIDDAKFLVNQFAPVFNETDLVNIERFNAYVKCLVDNSPLRPFSIRTIRDETKPDTALRNAVVQLSNLTYGKDRHEVEAMVQESMNSSESVGAADAVANSQGSTS